MPLLCVLNLSSADFKWPTYLLSSASTIYRRRSLCKIFEIRPKLIVQEHTDKTQICMFVSLFTCPNFELRTAFFHFAHWQTNETHMNWKILSWGVGLWVRKKVKIVFLKYAQHDNIVTSMSKIIPLTLLKGI